MPLGGSISTQTANSFFCSFFQKLAFQARAQHRRVLCSRLDLSCCCRFYRSQRISPLTAMARMCAGVVPQQPPRMRTPSAAASRAKRAKYSGEDFGYTMRSPSRLGKPALGMPLMRRSSTRLAPEEWEASDCGPSVQLAPMICTFLFFSSAQPAPGRISPKIVPSSE